MESEIIFSATKIWQKLPIGNQQIWKKSLKNPFEQVSDTPSKID